VAVRKQKTITSAEPILVNDLQQAKDLAELTGVAIQSSNLPEFKTLLQSAADCQDVHLQLLLDRHSFAQLNNVSNSQPAEWGGMFLEFAGHLHQRLVQQPNEPELWNMLGVVLFEIGRNASAEKCFKAALKLQPEHELARRNRKAARHRRSSKPAKLPFPANQLSQAKSLGQKVESVAALVALPDADAQTISLVMIVKNEEEMLRDCLASAQGLVNEIIIVDTGSTDRTKDIAREFDAKIIDFPWTGSFSEARNISLEHATGDWVLHLDADERLVPAEHHELRSLLARSYREGFYLDEHNYTGGGREEEPVVTHNTMRIWRNRPEYRFSGIIHEQKNASMPMFERSRFQDSNCSIIHFGYLKEVMDKKSKSNRNMELLLLEAQENPTTFNRFNIGTEYMALGDLDAAIKYFKESWDELKAAGDLQKVGFTNFLIIRLTRATRLSGQIEQAREYARQGLELFPQNNDLILDQAAMHVKEGNLEAAAELVQQAIANGEMGRVGAERVSEKGGTLGKGSFLARLLLGDIRERQGNPAEAVEIYETSLQQDPQYLGVIGNLTRALLMSGLGADDAVKRLEPYIAGHLGTAGLMAAHSLYERGYINHAYQLYQQVLVKLPGDPLVKMGLAECCLSRGEIQAAADICCTIEESNPLASAFLKTSLFCALLDDQDQQAKQLITRATELRLNPADQAAFQIWLDARSGDTISFIPAEVAGTALDMLEAALKLQKLPAAEQLIMLIRASDMQLQERATAMGAIFTRQGFLDSAAEAWLEWIDHAGPQADSLIGLAYIAHAEGQTQQALALAQDALAMEPDNQEAARMAAAFAA